MKKIISIVILVLVLLSVFLPGLLIKVTIDCHDQYGVCSDTVKGKVENLNGKSISFVKKEIKKRFSGDSLISSFSTQFKLPNILKLNIITKPPIFSLKSMVTNEYAMVSDDGTVLMYSNNSNLPTVYMNESLIEVGKKVDTKYKLALELMDGVGKMYQIYRGTLEGTTLLVDLPGGVRVIFPLVDADRSLLLGSLRLIYSEIQKETEVKYSQIDLRFKDPVLR